MAFVITGAGWDDANGFYEHTGKVWHDAPVYENDRKCILSREPHKNSNTGETSYGWILGQNRKPLYAVQSAAIAPPSSGWMLFSGAFPLPQLRHTSSAADGALMAAQAFKDNGNKLFGARRYDEADIQWSRAIGLGRHLMDELGWPIDESMHVALYANRSELRLRQQAWDAALADAQSALRIQPNHDKALLRAAVASRELAVASRETTRYSQAQEFVKKCLEAHPKHPEAKQMLVALERLGTEVHRSHSQSKLVTHTKLQQAILGTGEAACKYFGAKDKNNLVMFQGVEGYSDKKMADKSGRPALSAMPYHHMGLREGQVELMDQHFQETRAKNNEKEKREKAANETYEGVKLEYRMRAMEDIAEGRMAKIDDLLKSAPGGLQPKTAAENLKVATVGAARDKLAATSESLAERPRLSKLTTDEIDGLFAPFQKLAVEHPVKPVQSEEEQSRRARIAKATRIVSGLDGEE